MYTYSVPPEDIGVSCQEEEFNVSQLKEQFQSCTDTAVPECREEELKRVPLIQKTMAAANIKLSQEEAVRACKVYEPYIRDILQQVDAAIAIFVMEKQLRP